VSHHGPRLQATDTWSKDSWTFPQDYGNNCRPSTQDIHNPTPWFVVGVDEEVTNWFRIILRLGLDKRKITFKRTQLSYNATFCGISVVAILVANQYAPLRAAGVMKWPVSIRLEMLRDGESPLGTTGINPGADPRQGGNDVIDLGSICSRQLIFLSITFKPPTTAPYREHEFDSPCELIVMWNENRFFFHKLRLI